MNHFEAEIAKYERRIRKLEEHPASGRLRCNRLLYEALIEDCKENLRAWKAGEPFAVTTSWEEVFAAMGFHVLSAPFLADRVDKESARYLQVARNAGFPTELCDRFGVSLGMFLTGDLPRPAICTGANHSCDMEMSQALAIGYYSKCPVFNIDRYIEPDYEPVDYLMGEASRLIEFTEKNVPGVKFDEERMREIWETEMVIQGYLSETHEFYKARPCPVRGNEVFRLPYPFTRFLTPKAVEYFRALRDEVGELVKKGVGGIPEEKMRVMWLVSSFFHFDVFTILEKYGVSVPIFMIEAIPQFYQCRFGWRYWDESDSPLKRMVKRAMLNCWAGPAERWVQDVEVHCKEFGIDALIYFMNGGCPANLNSAKILADRVKSDLGLPTLLLEGRMLDEGTFDSASATREIENFITMCLNR